MLCLRKHRKPPFGPLLLMLAGMTLVACSGADKEVETPAPASTEKSQASTALSENTPFDEDYLRRSIKDEVFYFVMPDRFDNGDPDNDQGSKTKPISAGGYDPTSVKHYHGGDLKGMQNRLDYLKDMGISAIWMTPILRNQAVQGDSTGYHGYWPVDYTEVDPHLGSNEELKAFIDAAHANGMKVFFDIITNHTADIIKYKECHVPGKIWASTSKQLCEYISLADKAAGKGYTAYVPEGMENLKNPAWLNDPKYYNNQGDSTWQGENSIYGDFMGLDDVDTSQPEVVQGMIEIFSGLISQFKPDGFRIDTVKHVNIEFWQEFSPAIIEHAKAEGIPEFFIFGEVYDGDPKNLSYFTTVGKMPSVLDFAFQYRAKDVFVKNGGTRHLRELFEADKLYRDEDSDEYLLMNFVSNHDMGRIAHDLDKAMPEASEAEKIERVKLANALMYFARGIPVIYYGDEQGFTGDGNDNDAREDMMPSQTPSYNDNNLYGTDKTTADDNFDRAHPLYLAFKSYAEVYHGHRSLRHGKQYLRSASDDPGIFAISRIDHSDNIEYLVVFNSSADSDMSIQLQASSDAYSTVFGDALASVAEGKVEATLAPMSFSIFKASTAAGSEFLNTLN